MSEFKFYPKAVIWEITYACNMRCLHCGTSAGRKRPDELTTEEALALIDELTGLGAEEITLSGGEPLLRKDWRELARKVVANGLKAYLITNGYLVTREVAEEFAEIGFRNVGISFDGTEKTHNFIRQREDGFAGAANALKNMAAVGKHYFCAVTQVSNINIDELDEIRNILIDCGCPEWRIQMTTSTGRMMEHADLILGKENYPKLIDKIIELKKMGGIAIDVGENIGYYGCKGTELLDGAPYLGCYAGVFVAGIESNGNVKGCLSMQPQFVEGNIRDSSFTEIWNNPDGFAYNRKFTKESADGACRECQYLPLCRGGCTTTSVSATGKRADNPYCIYQMERARGIDEEMNPYFAEIIRDHCAPSETESAVEK